MLELKNSTAKGKKYMVVGEYNGKSVKVHFGSSTSSTFIDHNDLTKKKNYLARHNAIKLKDGTRAVDKILSPSFLSKWVLWNKKTLSEALKEIEDKFDIKIIDSK